MNDVNTAVEEGDSARLQELLDTHPDAVCYAPWKESASLLHHAAESAERDVMYTIVDFAGPLLHELDDDGQTPLHVAVNNGNLDAAKVLCATGRIRGAGCKELTIVDKYKMTPLHLACENGDEPMVAHLLTELNRQERASYVQDLRRGSANFLARQGQHQGV